MPSVHLDEEEWQKIMAILSQAPWNIANPLLMKMGDQLRLQKNSGNIPTPAALREKEKRQ